MQVSISEFIDEIRNEGKRIGISNGMFIQVVVVLARAKTTIFLFDKEEWGHLRGVRGADLSTIEVFLEEILGGLALIRRDGVDLSDLKRFVKVDLVVIGSRWCYDFSPLP